MFVCYQVLNTHVHRHKTPHIRDKCRTLGNGRFHRRPHHLVTTDNVSHHHIYISGAHKYDHNDSKINLMLKACHNVVHPPYLDSQRYDHIPNEMGCNVIGGT